MKKLWKTVGRVTSIVGVVASTIHYGPAVVGFIVKLNGWTAMLILCSSALLVGSAFEVRDYLNHRFTALDEAQHDALAEATATLDRRVAEETARLDSAIKQEISSRVAGDQMDRERIGRLEAQVGQLQNQVSRNPRKAKISPEINAPLHQDSHGTARVSRVS